MKILLAMFAVLCLAAPVSAQEMSQPPTGSMLSAIQQTLGTHLGVGVLASYDWVAGDWERPYSVGPVASWVVNDQLVISGGAKYILNAQEWRSEVQVLVPLYGGERMR